MAIALAIIGFAFAALCIWLTVRIVSRRERWAKWTAVALAVVLVGYPLSFGPALWLVSNGNITLKEVRRVYRPIVMIRWHSPAWMTIAIDGYAKLWADDGGYLWLALLSQ